MMTDDSRPNVGITTHLVKLNEKPCAVKYVEEFDGFIVGTYDCLPDISSLKKRFPNLSPDDATDVFEFTNRRIGSLNFLHHSIHEAATAIEPQVVHRCKHGGIFDMSITRNYVIYAAHANGYVAHYTFDKNQFHLLSSIKVTTRPTALLTSIDTSSTERDERSLDLVIVGDSQGRITLLNADTINKVLGNSNVTQDDDPVWQVKFVPDRKTSDEVLVLVASEDSSWYIYKITFSEETAIFHKLYTNRDFKAGVTSICFIPSIENNSCQFSALIGSYDESIRFYKVMVAEEGSKVQVQSALDSPILIAGGGIWRLNLVGKEHVYVAAMYAGTHRLSVSALLEDRQKAIKCDKIIELDEIGDDDNKPAPLHYGVDLSPRDSVACIVDYNNNSCIFVKLP